VHLFVTFPRQIRLAPSAFAFASPSPRLGRSKAKVEGAAPFCRAWA